MPLALDGDHGDLCHTCTFQGSADKADIVGGTAAAAGLAHEHGRLVEVIFSGQQSLHDLSHDDQGRIAGIIVYIL